jgi:uncharacterized protein (TIGR01732 family)
MMRSQALSFFFVLHILIMLKRGGETMGAVAGVGFGSGFALIVVLFILLIIIGASFWGGYGY